MPSWYAMHMKMKNLSQRELQTIAIACTARAEHCSDRLGRVMEVAGDGHLADPMGHAAFWVKSYCEYERCAAWARHVLDYGY